ncbi:MAG: tRNA dihydrouridine synthase DusB [Chitinispirillaceae bacterium]|nr:tRNA dihydrouridine synthase DusB [Chitinispirillaceae bacterium]
MAGITDPVFRSICKEHGADVTVSEMVSVDGIVYGADATFDLMRFESTERPIGIQLFGADPQRFAESTALVAQRFKPDFIDLNAGCPVPKVVKRNGGASLLKDLKQFERIVYAMVNASSIPVTVKLRSGWYKDQWVDVDFARCAQECGACAVTLHPRSQTMGFSGHSCWERIGEVKQSVAIPVIGNGDILNGKDALAMLRQTGCDGLMVGRGAYGNPWIFSEIRAVISGRPYTPPSSQEKLRLALSHIEHYRYTYGEYRAAREMKKHVSWYIKGIPGASQWRDRIFRAVSTDELSGIVRGVFS